MFPGITNIKVIQESVSKVLVTQAAIKASGPDKINIQILQMILY